MFGRKLIVDAINAQEIMNNKVTELKEDQPLPCPFCGQPALFEKVYFPIRFKYRCDNYRTCWGHRISTDWLSTEQRALEAWNIRDGKQPN